MKQRELEKNLRKAAQGDADAIAALAEYLGTVCVFVRRKGKVDVDATLRAIAYWRTEGIAPAAWDDLPTCTLHTAFRSEVQLDPIHLNPVTPGTWKMMWEREDGHCLVAAVHYGVCKRLLTGSEVEIMTKARAYLEDVEWPELDHILARMDEDPEGTKLAMDAVTSRRSHAATQQPRRQTVVNSVGVAQASGGSRASVSMPSPPSKYDVRMENAQGVVIGDRVTVQQNMDGARVLTLETLRVFLTDNFSLEELNTICFQLGFDADNLPSATRDGRARELVAYLARRSRLAELIQIVKAERTVNWAGVFGHQ